MKEYKNSSVFTDPFFDRSETKFSLIFKVDMNKIT